MFPRRERLSRALFPVVLGAGKRYHSLYFTAISSSERGGYAVVVSKKVARLSVTRHRIKRLITAALRKLALPPSLIVFPKSSIDSVSYEDTVSELNALLSRIH